MVLHMMPGFMCVYVHTPYTFLCVCGFICVCHSAHLKVRAQYVFLLYTQPSRPTRFGKFSWLHSNLPTGVVGIIADYSWSP